MKVIKVKSPHQKIELEIPGLYLVLLNKYDTSCKISLQAPILVNQSAVFQVTIHHQAPRTQAETIMKSVVGKRGSVKLVGKIVIDKGAFGCSSFLTQRILLLNESARGEAVPELEILNNDVRCSHAASISSIPEEQLHYLMARGLSKAKATRMIAEGFLRG